MDKRQALLETLKRDSQDSAPVERRTFGRLWLLAIALSASVPVLAYIHYGDDNKTPAAPAHEARNAASADATEASQAERAAVAPRSAAVLEASGYVVAQRKATVSTKMFGLITDVRVEEGNYIEAGDIIATLDDRQATVDLDLLKAEAEALALSIKSAEYELVAAKDELTREQSLANKGYSNDARIAALENRVNSVTNNIALAQTQHRAALLRVKRQQRALEDFVVRAPFSGVVTEQAAQLGEIISPSTAGGGFTRTGLCTIVDMDSLEIVVDVNEAFIDRIYKDQQVVGELYAYPGWQFEGRVMRIIPTADRAKATIKVRIKIAQQDEKILPQMGVKVVFNGAQG